jgi:pyrimidine operon attenuation protein/uracil phosphoribosyltransferase
MIHLNLYICQNKLHKYNEPKSITYCKEITIILHRLACQLRKTPRFYRYNISRIQPRGVFLAERLKEILEKEYQTQKFN